MDQVVDLHLNLVWQTLQDHFHQIHQYPGLEGVHEIDWVGTPNVPGVKTEAYPTLIEGVADGVQRVFFQETFTLRFHKGVGGKMSGSRQSEAQGILHCL